MGSSMCTYRVRATKWTVKVYKVLDYDGQILSFINLHLSGGWYVVMARRAGPGRPARSFFGPIGPRASPARCQIKI